MKSLMVLWFLLLPGTAQSASVWDALSVGVGAQGVWLEGGDLADLRDIEATGRAAFGVTPHIALVGGLAYGFDHAYTRESVGVRLTATDVNDPTFSVGLGVSRHFRSEPGGLDEWAGEAAIGWKPLSGSEFLLTASAAYGLDSSQRQITAGLTYPVKLVRGVQ